MCPKQPHPGSQGSWSLPMSLVCYGKQRICALMSTGVQATGLSTLIWVVNLWTLDRLQCRHLVRFPGQDPYSSKDLAHIMLATCLIMANQLTHPFLELLKICHAYMQGGWPVSFSLGFEPLDPWSTVAQTLGPSSKPCLDPNSTTNGFSCIIVCQNIIFEM